MRGGRSILTQHALRISRSSSSSVSCANNSNSLSGNQIPAQDTRNTSPAVLLGMQSTQHFAHSNTPLGSFDHPSLFSYCCSLSTLMCKQSARRQEPGGQQQGGCSRRRCHRQRPPARPPACATPPGGAGGRPAAARAPWAWPAAPLSPPGQGLPRCPGPR